MNRRMMFVGLTVTIGSLVAYSLSFYVGAHKPLDSHIVEGFITSGVLLIGIASALKNKDIGQI